MSTRTDELLHGINAERPAYQTGVLLDAQDFTAEQSYHRGRLARALAYLHGWGTAAGLAVEHRPATDDRPEELVVQPGLAIDRSGRLVELSRAACIRVDEWYGRSPEGDIRRAHYPQRNGVVADVFIRFAACATGKTPAFASGPFDALDAFAPARIRDAWFLELVPRREHSEQPDNDRPPDPVDAWAAFPLRPGGQPAEPSVVRDAVLAGWREGTSLTERGELVRLPEHGDFIDPSNIFLARVLIRTDAPAPDGGRPARIASREVTVDNSLRPFALPAGLLARWLGF
jgi:hypothetical protein